MSTAPKLNLSFPGLNQLGPPEHRVRFRRMMFLFPTIQPRFHFRCSTSSSSSLSASETHLNSIVDYLINTLGFSKEAAISVSSKVTRLRSTHNPYSVVNFFKTKGFDNTQIKNIVSSVPVVLTFDTSKTLEPKIRVLQELGLSSSDLAKHITRDPYFLRSGLHTQIIPIIDYLRKWLGSDEKVIKSLSRSKWVFSSSYFLKRMPVNVGLLQNYGSSNEQIVKILLFRPDTLIFKPDWLESKLHHLEQKWGIACDSANFVYALSVIIWYNESMLEKKVDGFRSFGWSDSDVSTLFRAFPLCLAYSEANICEKLDFFMKELGYTPAHLTKNHTLLSLSLEKRVKPRNKILKMLEEKKLVKPNNPSLVSLTKYSELRFVEFIRRYENEVPGLCETYASSIR